MNSRLLIVIVILMILTVATGASAVVPQAPDTCNVTTLTFGNLTDYPIADGAGVTISDVTVSAPPGMAVYDVDVTTNLQHPHSGDLKIYLIPPSGKVIVLSTDNGGPIANVFTSSLFDDDAGDTNPPGPVTDVTLAMAEPAIVPESAMATMRGINPTGKWSLYIYDTVPGNGGGVLGGWSLQISATQDNPTESFSTFTNNAVAAITDLNTTTSTMNVHQTLRIYDARLRLKLNHTYNGDLEITLISPQGTAVTISTDNGGSLDNVFADVLFHDKGWYPVTDIDFNIMPVLESAIPEEAMGAFTGEDAYGIWTLYITDDAGNDQGSLNGWSLEFSEASCGGSLLYDDFENNTLTTQWTLGGQWSEANHVMTANGVSKKASALADFILPCTDCSVHTQLRSNGGYGNVITLIGWYKNKENRIELMMKSDKNVWLFKEFVGGQLVQKKKYNELFAVGSYYDVRMRYNSDDNSISLIINNYEYGRIPLKAVPNGVFGMKVKTTVGDFTAFSVQQN